MEKRHCDVEEGRVLRYLRGPCLFSFGKGSTLPSNDTVNWTHRTTTNFSVFSVRVRVCCVCLFLSFTFLFSSLSFLSSSLIPVSFHGWIQTTTITTKRILVSPISSLSLSPIPTNFFVPDSLSLCYPFFRFFFFFVSFILLAPPPPLPTPLFFTAAARTRPVSRYTNV